MKGESKSSSAFRAELREFRSLIHEEASAASPPTLDSLARRAAAHRRKMGLAALAAALLLAALPLYRDYKARKLVAERRQMEQVEAAVAREVPLALAPLWTGPR